jgi:hypothetical protein
MTGNVPRKLTGTVDTSFELGRTDPFNVAVILIPFLDGVPKNSLTLG